MKLVIKECSAQEALSFTNQLKSFQGHECKVGDDALIEMLNTPAYLPEPFSFESQDTFITEEEVNNHVASGSV